MDRLESINVEMSILGEEMFKIAAVILNITPEWSDAREHKYASRFLPKWEELDSRFGELLEERIALEREYY